jgi:hypothetical protein
VVAPPGAPDIGFSSRTGAWLRSAGPLWLFGLASSGIYLFAFTLRFPLLSLYTRLVDMGGLTDYQPVAGAIYVFACASLLLLYVAGWRGASRLPFPSVETPIWAFGIVNGIINVHLYPAWAIDIFNYAVRGREWVRYGANPLITPPSAFPQDPFTYLAGGWGDHPTPYGPVWVILSAIPNLLARDNLLLNLVLFKLLAFLSYLGCAALVSYILAQVAPQYRGAGLLFFLWNPVVLLEVAGHGHNDATMMLFVLGSIALVVTNRRWQVLAPPVFVLSMLIKYTSAALGPLLAIRMLRSGRPALPLVARLIILVSGGLLAIIPIAAAYWPFWAGADTFGSLQRQNEICVSSVGVLISFAASRGNIPPMPPLISQWTPMFVIAVVYIVAMLAIHRRPEAWLRAGFEITFVLLYLLCSFEIWYLVWPLALVALLAPGLASWRMVVFCATAMLGTALFGYLWVWMMPAWGFWEIHLLVVPVVLGPPTAMAAWEWGRWVFRWCWRFR